MGSEKRIAYPVRELHTGTCRIVDAKGEWLSGKQVADALNAAREDAERYRALRAILRGDMLVHAVRPGACRSLAEVEHAMTDCTEEEIDEAVDAARAAQMTPDEEAEVRSRIEAGIDTKEKS